MAKRRILTIPEDEKILRKKSKKIEKIDALTKRILNDMLETIKDIGYGLSAPQVGILKRMIVVNVKGKIYKLINPRIVKKSEEMVCNIEGCLSVPRKAGDVDRHSSVTVKAQNSDGKTVKIEAERLLARVFQHELDHLDGILFIDKAKDVREIKEGEEEECDEDEKI